MIILLIRVMNLTVTFSGYTMTVAVKDRTLFHWSPAGSSAPGEPVFVVGNPGHTDRLKTVAQLHIHATPQYATCSLEMMDSFVDAYSKNNCAASGESC